MDIIISSQHEMRGVSPKGTMRTIPYRGVLVVRTDLTAISPSADITLPWGGTVSSEWWDTELGEEFKPPVCLKIQVVGLKNATFNATGTSLAVGNQEPMVLLGLGEGIQTPSGGGNLLDVDLLNKIRLTESKPVLVLDSMEMFAVLSTGNGVFNSTTEYRLSVKSYANEDVTVFTSIYLPAATWDNRVI